MTMQQFRPVPFYFLNTTEEGDLTLAEAASAIRRLIGAGYGGAILFNKPPTGFDRRQYLGEGWFRAIGNFLNAARDAGFQIWINDGWDYPPGDAGDRIRERNPELVQRRLILEDGAVRVEECDWGFPAFEEPESSRLFIELVYEEYFKRFEAFFGTTLAGFFSDADNRRSNHFTRSRMNGKPYYPWSREFAAGFRARYGYDIVPRLPGLMAGGDAEAAADYWEFASELYHNWFQRNHEWCRAHGVLYSFHSSDTGPLPFERCDRSSVFTEGETLRLLRFSDLPGTDHELAALDGGTHYDDRYRIPAHRYGGYATPNPGFADTRWDLRAKYAASAAWLYGRKRVLCEAFAATNWSASPTLLRRIAAWQIMQGVNFFVPHAVHHRFFGETKFFAPPEMLHMEGVEEFNAFLTRFSFVASQGEYADPVTVRDPTRSLWRGGRSEALFALCDKLSRMACNYVIVPESEPCMIDPATDEIELPEPFAHFDGGELAWMLRRLPDGTRVLLAANLWSEAELTGTIRFDGRACRVALAPGEIAVLGGPCEAYRQPDAVTRQTVYHDAMSVEWGAPNTVPLAGSAVIELRQPGGAVTLLLPDGCDAAIDGRTLSGGESRRVFDDRYRAYELGAAQQSFRLELRGAAFHTPAFLTGEFEVELADDARYFDYYNGRIELPGEPRIVLAARRTKLRPGSWADQGAPFYSGEATFRFRRRCEGDSMLSVDLGGCSAELWIDGERQGRVCVPPFRFRFAPLNGEHLFELRVVNTLANRMEMYRAPSGILSLEFASRSDR